mmetsp:Transcript_22109/g.65559  ORF Transcript_22109/g.65559 Transcript_22109/m.65559 type:complete len:352 (-) Transcript_22109:3527-4582(-)
MFSANENIVLRQQKRRITSIVESTLPEEALDMGTMVMVMQVTCRAPGCVPLETAIAVVFPRGQKSTLVPGLPESESGGTFKTKVLLPMSDVTKDDVLDALPPQFEGGRRTMKKICLRARDVTLAQITQIMNEEDLEGKRLMAEYLTGCLKDYVDNGCKAPEVGEPFPLKEKSTEDEGEADDDNKAHMDGSQNGSSEVVSNDENEEAKDLKITNDKVTEKSLESSEAVKRGVSTTGNFVVRRPRDSDENGETGNDKQTTKGPLSESASSSSRPTPPSSVPAVETATDWRRRQNMTQQVNSVLQSAEGGGGGQCPIQRLSEREHALGVRMAGCPCCDPDNPSNVVDSMMMVML